MLETLLGGLFGGVLRIVPELLKWLDRTSERAHELALLKLEMEFTKVQGQITMRVAEAAMLMHESDAIGRAFQEQSRTAVAAGPWVAAISALVRPLVTYAFVSVYFLVKLATYLLALEQQGDWREVIVNLWTQDDTTILFMIISFWFVGRVWERMQQK